MTAMSMRHGSPAAPGFWAAPTSRPQSLRRPDARILNEAIPLVAIGRNRAGLWVARDCDSSTGRAFIFKGSAVRFAKRMKRPGACALMFVNDGLELAPGTDRAQSQKVQIVRSLLILKARVRRFWRRLQNQRARKV